MARQTSNQPILIDRAAAAELPPEDAIRDWARDKRAFISSVMAELPEERKAVADAIRQVGLRAVMFEEFGGRDADPEEAYLAEVQASDIYIGILANRYGKPLKTRYSATHTEYLHAEKHSLRIAIWTTAAQNREGHEQSLLDELRTFHVVPEVRSVEDLRRQVAERLKSIAAEDLAPWCKLGNIIFRSYEVVDRGNVISVSARVKDDVVARAMEDARGDQWNRGHKMQFTWSGRSRYVKVTDVHVTTTTAKSKKVQVELEVEEGQSDPFVDVSFGGKTPEDLTEIALRSVLFGQSSPVSEPTGFGFVTEITDPLQPLRASPVSEEIIRPITELLLTEFLVGTGRANSIREFRLGISIQGRRNFALTWETGGRYANMPVGVRSIKGEIRI